MASETLSPAPLKIPLCAYVEENVPIEATEAAEAAAEAEALNKTENAPFNDPNLGCVQCQMEPYEQCSNVPQKSCQLVPDPHCKLCPPDVPKTRRPFALDITDQNEVRDQTFYI